MPGHTGVEDGKIRRESKGKEKNNKKNGNAGQVKQHKQHYNQKSYKEKIK